MTEREMVGALEQHFGVTATDVSTKSARITSGDGDWLVAMCPGQPTAPAHLMLFEQAMQTLLDAEEPAHRGLAIDFGPVEGRERPSYRKALKKYSSSIVFEDLQISLLLISSHGVQQLSPNEVNPFLRDLDAHLRGA